MGTIAILTSQLRLEPGAMHKYWTSQDRVRVRGGPCDWGIELETKVYPKVPEDFTITEKALQVSIVSYCGVNVRLKYVVKHKSAKLIKT